MYGFCDDRNDSELLSWMAWMTMAPRCAPPGPQMLRPACSSCRSCAPNGLISPNVRHSQLSSFHVWFVVSSGRLSANRSTKASEAL